MPRVNRRIPVDLYVNKMINGVPFLARTRDLSREGVFVHRLLEPQAPNGAHIAVEFALPGTAEVIWAEDDIVHDTDNGQGLRFRELTPKQTRLIEDFIANTSAVG